MLWVAGSIATLIARHPRIKVLALAFLVLIGGNLVAEALGFDIPTGYLYFALGFGLSVELLNLRRP
jgi:predicted tellurium resistance membrane protein TerC